MAVDSTYHLVDSKGDAIIILHDPNAPFAQWKGSAHAKDALEPKRANLGLDPSVDDNRIFSAEWESWILFQSTLSSQPPANTIPPKDIKGKGKAARIVYRVSSKHLSLASSFFQRMLEGRWIETGKIEGTGLIMTAHDWDENAFLILLNIIHGRNSQVPRSLDRETLAKVAVMVDYYHCHEAVEHFSETWYANMRYQEPEFYGRDLVMQLAISYVFQWEGDLTSLCKIALFEMKGPMDTLDLPIPKALSDWLEHKRRSCVKKALEALYMTQSSLATGWHPDNNHRHNRCQGSYSTTDCTASLLGALTRKFAVHGLMAARPQPPFIGYSIASLTYCLESFAVVSPNGCTFMLHLEEVKRLMEQKYRVSENWKEFPCLWNYERYGRS